MHLDLVFSPLTMCFGFIFWLLGFGSNDLGFATRGMGLISHFSNFGVCNNGFGFLTTFSTLKLVIMGLDLTCIFGFGFGINWVWTIQYTTLHYYQNQG